jgi:hypothetical protein
MEDTNRGVSIGQVGKKPINTTRKMSKITEFTEKQIMRINVKRIN